MSTHSEPFTFDTLTTIYRQEMASASLVKVRKDMYRCMVNLTNEATDLVDKEMAVDPESSKALWARTKRKNILLSCKHIKAVRAAKIATQAVRTIEGSSFDMNLLCNEEVGYYNEIVDITNRFYEKVGS